MIKYTPGNCKIKCPFCGKGDVSAFHRLSFLQASKSSISAGSKTTYHRKDEVYEIAGDCPNCGAKEKDVYNKVNGISEEKNRTKEEHKKRLKRLQSIGLLGKIMSKRG